MFKFVGSKHIYRAGLLLIVQCSMLQHVYLFHNGYLETTLIKVKS